MHAGTVAFADAFSGFSQSKAKLDRLAGLNRPWRLHDLRHTFGGANGFCQHGRIGVRVGQTDAQVDHPPADGQGTQVGLVRQARVGGEVAGLERLAGVEADADGLLRVGRPREPETDAGNGHAVSTDTDDAP